MKLIGAADLESILGNFGYSQSSDVLAKLKHPNENTARFTVPLHSLRQAAISEATVNAIVSKANGIGRSAVVWLTDWPIYYEYELRLFWKNVGCDIVSGKRPDCSAAYWPCLEEGDADRIKSAYFTMMAFEFSGCILFNSDVSICVDDGTVIVAAEDESLRNEMQRIAPKAGNQ